MKTIDYILIGIIVVIIAGGSIYIMTVKKNAEKQVADNIKLIQLQDQEKALAHQSDSLASYLKVQNRKLTDQVAGITAERDSLIAVTTHQLTNIKYAYQDKINRLSVLPDDSLHGIFAKQLSASGSH